MDIRTPAAVLAGRVVASAARLTGRGGGTALPGIVAERIHPQLLSSAAGRLRGGVVLVSGTNGKTTTSRLLASMLSGSGLRVMHNRAGSNLMRGIVSSVVLGSRVTGRPSADIAVFETDEAVLPHVLQSIAPRVLVLNNLFRDQLDRYGELDTLFRSWEAAARGLPADTWLVVNGDDPSLARIAEEASCRTLLFGLDSPHLSLSELPHAADSAVCPRCRTPLEYSAVYVSHIGEFRCPSCGFARREPDLTAADVRLHGTGSTELTLRGVYGDQRTTLGVPGVYNVYNALAAAAAAYALGLDWQAAQRGIEGFTAAFGRFERVWAEGKELILALIKNPVGCNEVLRMFASEPLPEPLLVMINDLTADGRDVSWLWDADFEMLAEHPAPIVCSGLRAADMAVRLKYAGVPAERVVVAEDVPQGLAEAMRRTSAKGTLRIMPTYTAMLALRAHMGTLGWVEPYWEE